MGCGASKVLLKPEEALNNNGHAQQVVRKSSIVEKIIEPSEQDKQVSNPPETQAEPAQQNSPEPEKLVSKPASPEPGAAEPVQEDHKKDEPSNEKPAPIYTEESLQEVLQLEEKLSSMENKGVVGQYQTQHRLLVSRYADLQAAQKKVEGLKQQTYVVFLHLVLFP